MRVMKFGGTSVASAERLRRVAWLAARAARSERVIVVVSALAGVTDALVQLVEDARRRRPTHEALAALCRRHAEVLAALGGGADEAAHLSRILTDVTMHLAEVQAGAPLPPWKDAVVAAGERLALVLAVAACRAAGLEARPWDTRRLVRTDATFGEATVDDVVTTRLVRQAWRQLPRETVAVATGFIAADAAGRTTTLGRGGSDYTASLLGTALGAALIEIWTDVDGVLSAPPRVADLGHTVPYLDYEEAFDLARFGGKVLHPKTMLPAARARIPVVVRNTFAPDRPGTTVGPRHPTRRANVCAVSVVDDCALARLSRDPAVRPDCRNAGALPCCGPGSFPDQWVVPPQARAAVAVERPADVRAGLALVALVGRGLTALESPAAMIRAALRAGRVPVLATVDTGSPVSAAVVVPRGLQEQAVWQLHRRFVRPAATLPAAVEGR